jgi:prepilin-type N-terminal cleavage/methylation domain-containing protein
MGKAMQGFTIIEIMIVIAIMGFMLAAAVVFLGGDVSDTNFKVDADSLQQQMTELITQTASGYTADNNSYSCSASSDGSTPVTITTPGTNIQGASYGCITLGKLIQFNPRADASPEPNEYFTYPVVGNQFVEGVSPLTLNAARPVLVTSDNETDSFQGDLSIYSVTAKQTASSPLVSTTAIGIFDGDAAGNIASINDDSDLNSGVLQLSLYYDTESAFTSSGITSTAMASDVAGFTNTPSSFSSAYEVFICVSGGSNQSALLTIGGSGSLNVGEQLYHDGTCL